MTIDDVIRKLGEHVGLPLALDANQTCRLVIDGTIEVDLDADPSGPQLVISGAIGTVPASGQEALFRVLLEANLFGRGTGGAVLALDERFNEIVLSRTLMTDRIHFQDVIEAIEQFVHHSKIWRERLSTLAHSPPAQDLPADPAAGPEANILRV